MDKSTTTKIELFQVTGDRQSPPEYQAKKKAEENDHLGTAPRLQFPGSPRDVILEYSFKIVGGKGTMYIDNMTIWHAGGDPGSVGNNQIEARCKQEVIHLADPKSLI